MLKNGHCGNADDMRECESYGYAAAYFKGWPVEPAPVLLIHPQMGECIVTGSRKVGGQEYWTVYNRDGDCEIVNSADYV